MKIAYFDCFAGAAGDMIAGAMLDAGLGQDVLKERLATLGIKNLHLDITRTSRAGISALRFKVLAPEQQHNRNLPEITKLIEQSGIAQKAKSTAIAIFEKLAKAEAKIHDKEPTEVAFHEVGAIDSIVDIVSASVGLHELGIEKVYCSALTVGSGMVNSAHGAIPVPAPATAELLKAVPITAGPIRAEMLTPTAAAILTTITESFCPLPAMEVQTIGYGAGSLNPEKFPNVLRLFLGQTASQEQANADTICLLQTNIDDVTGEVLGFIKETLFRHKALDVFTIPVAMKKNRPAVELNVICTPEEAQKIEQIIFEEGLTFGIRKQFLQRSKLQRDFVTVTTQFGEIKIKVGSLQGRAVTAKPEFADCIKAAERAGVPVKTVSEAAIAAYRNSHHQERLKK